MIKIIQQRIYAIETDALDDDFDYMTCSDDEFIEEAEISGLIWEDLEEFVHQLNNSDINPQVTYFRVISYERK
jgi:hypothetical protein